MHTTYRQTFATARERGLLAAATAWWLSVSMVGLAVVLVVVEHTGSFAMAGLAVGGFSAGSAALAPLRGRLVDRKGGRNVLPVLGGAYCAGLLLVLLGTMLPVETLWFIAGAALAGAAAPPLIASVRAQWGRALAMSSRRAAYAVLSAAGDAAQVVGPVLVAVLAAAASPELAVALCGLLGVGAVVGTRGGMTASVDVQDAPAAGRSRVLRSRGMRALVSIGVVFGLALGALDIALPAFAGSEGEASHAGVLLGAFAAGSLIGGLAYGRVAWERGVAERYVLSLLIAALAFLPLAFADSLLELGVLLACAGATYGVASVSLYELLDLVAPEGAAVEAFTWITTAEAIGLAAGGPLSGALASASGPTAALAVSAVAMSTCALVALSVSAALGARASFLLRRSQRSG